MLSNNAPATTTTRFIKTFSYGSQLPAPAADQPQYAAKHRKAGFIPPASKGQSLCWRCASRLAIHTRSAVAGISMRSILYSRHSPSLIAFTTAGHEPIAPASPAPLAPGGLRDHGTWAGPHRTGGPRA